jgi:hypothetical protein
MFFLFKFAFCFGFSGGSVVYAGSCGKAERPPETHHDCARYLKEAVRL